MGLTSLSTDELLLELQSTFYASSKTLNAAAETLWAQSDLTNRLLTQINAQSCL